jgi:hypothetical protein
LAHTFQLELAAIRYLVESGLFNLRGFSLYIESYWLLEYHSQLMESCFGGSLILPRELKSLDFPDVLMNKDLANPDYSLGEFYFYSLQYCGPFNTLTFCLEQSFANMMQQLTKSWLSLGKLSLSNSRLKFSLIVAQVVANEVGKRVSIPTRKTSSRKGEY